MTTAETTPIPTDPQATRSSVSYATAETLPWYAQRRTFRLLMLVLLLNIIAVTSITWGPITAKSFTDWREARRAAEAAAQAEAVRQQQAAAKAAADQQAAAARAALVQKLLAYQLPTGHVAYTEDAAEAATFLADGQAGYSAVVTSSSISVPLPHPPVVWDSGAELRGAGMVMGNNRDGTLFVHAMKSAGGTIRLVWFTVHASVEHTGHSYRDNRNWTTVSLGRRIEARLYDPSSPTTTSTWNYRLEIRQPADQQLRVLNDEKESIGPRGFVGHPGDRLRLRTATPDAADPSRVRLPYSLAGKAGSIDVTLGDDGRLRTTVDRGVKTLNHFSATYGGEIWDPWASGN